MQYTQGEAFDFVQAKTLLRDEMAEGIKFAHDHGVKVWRYCKYFSA